MSTAGRNKTITREVQREKEKYRSLSEGTADLILTYIPEFGEQNIQDVCEALKEFSFAAVPEWWIQSALKFAGIPESRSRNVVGEEEKWRSLRAWTALFYLDMFSSIYPHLPEDRSNLDAEILRLLKPHQNNSYDSAIAAGAAYGELFVSNDQDLTARCEHLRKRGCLKFRTVARDDWLLAAPRRTSPSC